MIESVEIENIRGISKVVEFKNRTLVTGPNGSGKSTIPVAIDFALLGLVPGYKKNETFANASSDFMRAVVNIKGHSIERILTKGKTLSERIAIDNGTAADPKAAVPMLELILGQEPPVLNMPAFWNSTSTEKRRLLLKLVADSETQKKLEQDENKARGIKNDITRTRQVAEKTVENLTKRLAGLEKPAGNLAHMKNDIVELTNQIRETEKKVADGEAVEKTLAILISQKVAIKDLKESIKINKKLLKKSDVELKRIESEIESKGKEPVFELSGKKELSDNANEIVGVVVSELNDINSADDSTLCIVHESISSLKPLLHDADEGNRSKLRMKWIDESRHLCQSKHGALVQVSKYTKLTATSQAELKVAQQAEKKIEKLGDNVDPKDRAALDGMNSRRSELESKIDPLQQIDTIGREIEQARLEAEKALVDEDNAKKALEVAVREQQAVVECAADELAERSKTILPYGNLRLFDDGKDISVYWAKTKDLKVQRNTLSGGEQALFDCALGHALAASALIVIEGAEIDDNKIVELMNHIPEQGEFQVMIVTCHEPKTIPEDWHHISIES